jgi:hypothetical protein
VHIAYSIAKKERKSRLRHFFWCNPQIELKLFYDSHLVTSTSYPLGGWQLIGFTPHLSLSKTKSTKISLATSRQMKKNWHFGLLSALFHWLSRIFYFKMVFIPHFRLH